MPAPQNPVEAPPQSEADRLAEKRRAEKAQQVAEEKARREAFEEAQKAHVEEAKARGAVFVGMTDEEIAEQKVKRDAYVAQLQEEQKAFVEARGDVIGVDPSSGEPIFANAPVDPALGRRRAVTIPVAQSTAPGSSDPTTGEPL